MPRLIYSLVTSTALLSATAAAAVEIKMVASNAVKETYLELLPEYQKATGNKVKVDWVGTLDIVQRIGKDGEVADVVIAPSFTIDELIKQGRLAAGRIDVAKSMVGVAIRPGAPKPDLSSATSLRRYLLGPNRIVISAGPSGMYLRELFAKTGIADVVKDRLTQLPPGASPGVYMAQGKADIGFTQVSEFLAIKGIEFLGPAPGEFQKVTIFSAGVHKNAPQAGAAKDLLKFLTGPKAVPILKKTGLDLPSP